MKLLLLFFFTITPFLIHCQTTEKEKEGIIKKYIINDQMFKMSEMFYENQLSTVKDSHE